MCLPARLTSNVKRATSEATERPSGHFFPAGPLIDSSLMVRVKICGVTTPEDACVAARAGAHAIGLNFHPASPRCVDAERARAIASAVPAGLCKVGVFVDMDRETVRRLCDAVPLDAIQFHGAETPEDCCGWTQKVIKAFRLRDRRALEAVCQFAAVDFVLVDAYVPGVVGGTGKTVPWEWLGDLDRSRLILAGGLTSENVAEAVRRVRPAWVDVASGVERSPGVKDPERVRRFIENAQSA